MPRIKKPIAPTEREFLDSIKKPYLGGEVTTPPLVNRGEQISLKGEKFDTLSIGLTETDETLVYYFENVVKPSIVRDGTKIDVPIRFATQDIWKSMQADGYIRDRNGKAFLPLLVFKKESIEKNRTLGNKLDGNQVTQYSVFEKQYSKRNYYDNFGALNNRIPEKEYHVGIVPDYVTIKYSGIIFTDYVEQNNKLIESILFTSDSYWGNDKFRFLSKINVFSPQVFIDKGDDKLVKTTFDITLNGYIIPDSINKENALQSVKIYSTSQVIFNMETTGSL